mgnify:CR=1 FL=1
MNTHVTLEPPTVKVELEDNTEPAGASHTGKRPRVDHVDDVGAGATTQPKTCTGKRQERGDAGRRIKKKKRNTRRDESSGSASRTARRPRVDHIDDDVGEMTQPRRARTSGKKAGERQERGDRCPHG